MDAIVVENLTKKYKDVTAVNNLSLSVKEGELYSLLGVNGAGKTTLIKVLCGLTKPTSGKASVLDYDVIEPECYKNQIAISPQETAVANALTVRENLCFMCGVFGITGEEKQSRITDVADKLKLTAVLDKKASKLSGGYQRRLSIAMALISQPRVLFLDEPTLGLDVIARAELWEVIVALKGKITIILTTHYMEEAESLSDRIAVLKSGKLLAQGTLEQLKAQTDAENLEKAFIKLVKEDKHNEDA